MSLHSKFQSLDDVLKENFTEPEIDELRADAKTASLALEALQDSISTAIADYMSKEKIGFNELVRRLDMSTSQTSLILKGKANLRLNTLIELARVMGKKPKVIFE